MTDKPIDLTPQEVYVPTKHSQVLDPFHSDYYDVTDVEKTTSILIQPEELESVIVGFAEWTFRNGYHLHHNMMTDRKKRGKWVGRKDSTLYTTSELYQIYLKELQDKKQK